MNLRRLLPLIALCLATSACVSSPPPPPRRGGAPPAESADPSGVPLRELDDEQLADLLELSRLVVIARVEERIESKGAISYRVELDEVLVERASLDARPLVPKNEIVVSEFLFREGRGSGAIGPLVELGRYLFFLAPNSLNDGTWFNLDDAAGFPLPAAAGVRARIDALLSEKRKAAEKSSPREDRP